MPPLVGPVGSAASVAFHQLVAHPGCPVGRPACNARSIYAWETANLSCNRSTSPHPPPTHVQQVTHTGTHAHMRRRPMPPCGCQEELLGEGEDDLGPEGEFEDEGLGDDDGGPPPGAGFAGGLVARSRAPSAASADHFVGLGDCRPRLRGGVVMLAWGCECGTRSLGLHRAWRVAQCVRHACEPLRSGADSNCCPQEA